MYGYDVPPIDMAFVRREAERLAAIDDNVGELTTTKANADELARAAEQENQSTDTSPRNH